jgi:hypothetical protein
MFKEINKSDINVRPFKVYKSWSFTESDIPPIFGKNITGSLFDIATDETTTDGIYKRTLYNSIKSQFYTNSATASILTEVGKRKSYASTDERVIGDDILVISLPQNYYGDGIKVGSFSLISGSCEYSDDGFSNIVSGSEIYGNVFYDRGLVVLTKDIVSGSTFNEYTFTYNSTKTIYENEIFISILENEFNYSQNPTALYSPDATIRNIIINKPKTNELYTSSYYDSGVQYIRTVEYPFTSSLDNTKFYSFDDYDYSSSVDLTGSYLSTYITTIGLYDNENNMIAVAKLPQPIKSLRDYPVNFIVRFDT